MTKIEVTVVESKDKESCNITVHKIKEYRSSTKGEITTGNFIKGLIDNVITQTVKGN